MRGKAGFFIAIATLFTIEATAQPAQGQLDLQMVGPARPPYIIDQDGMGQGPAVELVQQLAAAIGMEPTVRILPFPRAVMALDSGNTIYPALLRTPQREKKYAWIGEVFADRAVFFTRAGQSTVNDLDAARRLPVISVMRGSELQHMLTSFGIEKLEANASEADNARLLMASRIDGWFGLKAVGRATWRELGFNPTDLRNGDSFAVLNFWIAASANLPPATIARLQATYRAMRADGRYQRIIAPLVALSAPA